MSKEAMKLALEALEYIYEGANNQGPHTGISWRCVSNKAEPAITALREALAKPDFWEGYVPEPNSTCSNALRIQHKPYPRTCKKCGLGPCVELAQQALDKKAENARELGLDYEPANGTQVSKVWWDGEKLMAKPVPLDAFYEPAQQEPVQNNPLDCNVYLGSGKDHAIKHHVSYGPAQRTWVGLTDEEITDIWAEASPYYHEDDFARAIEAKLRSKNEDRN